MKGKLILNDEDFNAKVQAARIWIQSTLPEELAGVDMLKGIYQIRVDDQADPTLCSVLFFQDDKPIGEFGLRDDIGKTIGTVELASLLVMAGNIITNAAKDVKIELLSVLARHRRQKVLEQDGTYRDNLEPVKVFYYGGEDNHTIEC